MGHHLVRGAAQLAGGECFSLGSDDDLRALLALGFGLAGHSPLRRGHVRAASWRNGSARSPGAHERGRGGLERSVGFGWFRAETPP